MPLLYRDSHKFYDLVKNRKAEAIKINQLAMPTAGQKDLGSLLEKILKKLGLQFTTITTQLNKILKECIKQFQKFKNDPKYKMVK